MPVFLAWNLSFCIRHFAGDMSRDNQDEPIVPGWNGETTGWFDYCRRVRLCHAQTIPYKRHLLGPKLALKLRGKAWDIAASIDHGLLATDTGAQYLLQFLKGRLGKLPIPDIGQHLDEVFVKLRRAPGVDLITWCNQLREAYRKLQRALSKTRTPHKAVGVQTDISSLEGEDCPDPSSPSSSSHRRQSVSEPQREPAQPTEGAAGAEARDELPGEEPTSPDNDARSTYSGSDGWGWRNWYGWNRSWGNRWNWHEDSFEEAAAFEWEELESSLPEILPEEVLGWLLLRRSGLSSSSKLSIQAAAGNSLKYSDIERAMRQQEDELLHAERQKAPQAHQRGQRTYWLESEGQWGLLMDEPEDWDNPAEELVHWVDHGTMASVFGVIEPEQHADSESAWFSDGWYDWSWHDDEWQTLTSDGWISYVDMKPWMDIDEVNVIDQSLGKELHDLYIAYDQKLRTFKESRELLSQKGKSRGFYHVPKGNPKSKGKGTPKGKKGHAGSIMVAHGYGYGKGKGSPTSSSSVVNQPGYRGCFNCGDKTHDYRTCHKRGQGAAKSTAQSNMICMVTASEPGPSSSVSPPMPSPPVQDVQRMVLAAAGDASDPNRLGYAVIDTGATETVGSLDAVEFILQQRFHRFGHEEVGIDPQRIKKFRFGNAQERYAESYLLLPQTINGQSTSLGVYTLDVPNVPILLGIKTLCRLGAEVNVRAPSLVFTERFPGITIPLIRARNGHLLLDLCKDWHGIHGTDSDIPQTLQEHPEEKGSAAPEEPHMFDVHVIETKSETSEEGLCAVPWIDGVTSHVSASLLQEGDGGILASSSVSHGTFRGDPEGLGSEGQRRDCPPDGHGEPNQEEGPGHGQVRLGSHAVCGPSGPSLPGREMQGTSHHRQVLQRKPVRTERTCPLVELPGMHASSHVHSSMGCQGHVPQSGTSTSGHPGEVEQDRGQRSPSRGTGNESLGFGGGREQCSSPAREDQVREGTRGQGESQGQDRLCIHNRSSDQEAGQERASTSSGGPRSAGRLGGHGRSQFGNREPGSGDPGLKSPSDLPGDIIDDALTLQASESSVFSLTRPLQDDQMETIVQQLKGAHDDVVEILQSMDGSSCDLMEVCCGDNSSLTNMVQQHVGIAYRVGLQNNMDLSTDVGFQRARQFAKETRPRWMWISLPCGPESPLQALNQRTPEQTKRLKQKRRKHKIMIRHGVQLAREQLERGGHLGWEWPRNNGGWYLPEVQRLIKYLKGEGIYHFTRLDGCQVVVIAQDSGNPMKKPWSIMSTSIHMHHALNLTCPGSHEHDSCMGHQRARNSAYYPRRMCELISRVVMVHTLPQRS